MSDNEPVGSSNTPMSAVQLYIEAYGSARLINCIRLGIAKHYIPYDCLEDYLSDPLQLRLEKLKKMPKVGIKTAHEFNDLAVKLGAIGGINSDYARQVGLDSAEAVNTQGTVDRKERFGPKLDDRYSGLTSREKGVIERRFAIGRHDKHTLEEVSRIYKVTRERIRQLESKALRKLRSAVIAECWMAFINENESQIIDALFGEKPLISAPAKTSGEFSLAIKIVYGTDLSFLGKHTQKFQDCYWVKPGLNILDIQTARNRLAPIVKKAGVLPLSVLEAAQAFGVSGIVIEAAVASLDGHRLYKQWVIRGNATARKKRVVNILNLFLSGSLKSPVTLWDMKIAYWVNYGDDKCSGRDLLLSLQEHPDHFVNLRELGWLCVVTESKGWGDILLDSHIAVPDEIYCQPVKKGLGLANCVYEMFEKHGPLRLNDAADTFQRAYPQYKVASMYPMLVYFAVFRRFAPGIFGIQAHCRSPEALGKAREIMLTTRDLELYLLSRAAGPPRLRYFLWDTEMEKLWADWLSQNGDCGRLGALLSVARITQWDVNESDRSDWVRRKKTMNGKIDIPEMPLLSERRIDTSMLTTALAAASVFGFVNWMYLNQALGWRIETSRVALVMAVLIRVGALKPTGAWCEPHMLTKRGQQMARSILGRSIVSIAQPAKTVMNYLEECKDANRELGWAAIYSFDELLSKITDVSGECGDESHCGGEEERDLEAAYDGFMGDTLKRLIEGA